MPRRLRTAPAVIHPAGSFCHLVLLFRIMATYCSAVEWDRPPGLSCARSAPSARRQAGRPVPLNATEYVAAFWKSYTKPAAGY